VLTSKAQVMGSHVNRRRTTICACACVTVIIALNAVVLLQQLASA
jgi:Mn2+/Fe2+ NRAMP family transporter